MTTDIPLALTFSDVLLQPQLSSINSRSQVSLKTQLTPKFSIDFPVTATNMDCITGIDMAIAMHKFGSIAFYPRFAPPEIQQEEVSQIFAIGCNVVPSVGIKPAELERFERLVRIGAKIILIDVAHAHQTTCLEFIKFVKSKHPEVELIVGAAATYEAARDLFLAGADAVRVGVGPGSTCTTRIMTGSGMPQITAIMSVAKAAKEFNRPIIADGGMKNSGDIVKALAAGASAVTTGNILSGTNETPGNIIKKNNQQYKAYNGSTSKAEKLRQYQKDSTDKHPDYINYVEGVEGLVPLRGPVSDLLSQLDKGIRSGFTYSGARSIEELHQKAKFVQVTSSISAENSARGVTFL
jgi:IMP dehydrogenase